MSQVLVSSPPMPPLAPSLPEAVDCSLPQQQPNGSVDAADTACIEEKRTASQLAHLASQHHTSEYNRLKFGPNGASIIYIPLSIQMPDHVRDLKARQFQQSQKRAWWPAKAPREALNDLADMDPHRNNSSQYSSEAVQQVQQENIVPSPIPVYTPDSQHQATAHYGKPFPTLNHLPTLNLQRELSVAMSSPLSIITIPQLSPHATFHQPNLNLHAKTSESHPINISPIVPFELLPLITSHLASTLSYASHMFELPPSLLLHHLIAQTPSLPNDTIRSYPLMRVTNSNLPFPDVNPLPPDQYPLGTYGMPMPMSVATESSVPIQPAQALQSSNWLPHCGEPENPVSSEILPLELDGDCTPALPPFSSLSPPSIHDRPHSAPPSMPTLSPFFPESVTNGVATSPPPLPEVVRAMSSDILASVDDANDMEKAAVSHSILNETSPSVAWAIDAASSLMPPLRPALGNMLLSSCPGKKVRLSGPVKGRGAICRDLGHDLRRVKALGVGCVICCLDDDELELLGASWPQYSVVAQAVGLDVLRIPIPEGLSPITPALFDQHLSYIIHSYTLQGIPVLVHCRGGVGRAGLVACCWILKLGLCGWVVPTVEDPTTTYPVAETGDGVVKVRRDTLELVERVIDVVRRRRSVKAIETYEQVRFLVEFVEHLKAGSTTPNSEHRLSA